MEDEVGNMLFDWAILAIKNGTNLEESIKAIKSQVQQKEKEYRANP